MLFVVYPIGVGIGVNVFVCKISHLLLSCQPRVTVRSCYVYTFIRDLESIEHSCINPINTQVFYPLALAQVVCKS